MARCCRYTLVWRILLFLLATGGLSLSLGFRDHAPMLWIAPVPLLLLVYNLGPILSFLAAFAACLAALATIFWKLGYEPNALNIVAYLGFGIDRHFWLAPLLWYSLGFAGIVFVARLVVRQVDHWTSLLAYPCAWVIFEMLLRQRNGGATEFSIALSQMNLIPILQIASLTGLLGITFLVTLVPSALAVALYHRDDRMQWPFALATALLALGGTYFWGKTQLTSQAIREQATDDKPLVVSLVSVEVPDEEATSSDPEIVRSIVAKYAQGIAEVAVNRPQVVVLPERLLTASEAMAPELQQRFAELAKTHQSTLVVGIDERQGERALNTAWVFAPDGTRVLDYHKRHLIPVFEEAFLPGREIGIIPESDPIQGVTICKDMDFPDWIGRYSAAGATVLYVPALDFRVDGWYHARSAILRGVEAGMAVVRNGHQGLLTISDAHGRLVAFKETEPLQTVTLSGRLEPGPSNTFYVRTGDWMVWLCVVVLCFQILLSLRAGPVDSI